VIEQVQRRGKERTEPAIVQLVGIASEDEPRELARRLAVIEERDDVAKVKDEAVGTGHAEGKSV
jgi:hypothetical protein